MDNVLHKTTYIWKEEENYAIIIKNNGMKAILNEIDTIVWNHINDEDSANEIITICYEKYSLHKKKIKESIDRLVEVGLVTTEDMFWGDDLL